MFNPNIGPLRSVSGWSHRPARISTAFGPCTAIIAVASVSSEISTSKVFSDRIHATSFAWLEALTTMRKTPCVTRYTMMSSTNPPAWLGSSEYWPRPSPSFDTSLVVIHSRNSSVRAPRNHRRAMWLTSNIPAPSRTARASAITPVYCTGIS